MESPPSTADNEGVMTNLTLITGGTGKTGRRIAARLSALNRPFRIGSRSADPPFDWDKPATWPAALDGATAAYISFYPDLALPGAAATVESFADTARRAGVKHLVLLSGRGEAGAQRAEQAIRDSGLAWTIVRSAWFAQNFTESFLAEPLASGVVVFPARDVREPFIDLEDVADVAVAALTEPRHQGQLYEVTGPRLMTFAEAVAELARASGRDIRYVACSFDEYAAGMREQGWPAEVVDGLTGLFMTVLDGRNASLADGVERALGRPPRDFVRYANGT